MNRDNSIDLTTGRSVRIIRLNQWATYMGLVEGLPTAEMNRGIVNATLKEARCLGWHANRYLIGPTEEPIGMEGDRYPFGEPVALPSVICVALLHSDGPDPTKYSSLMVIWFQSSFAFPIEDAALGQIRKIDWDAKATVYDV